MIRLSLFISCILGSATVVSSFALSPGHLNVTRNGTAINSTGHATGRTTRISLPKWTSVLVLPSTENYLSENTGTPLTASSKPEVVATISPSGITNVEESWSSTVPSLATSSDESRSRAAFSSDSTRIASKIWTSQTAHSSTGYAIRTIGPRSSSSIVPPAKPLYYSNSTSGVSNEVSASRISPSGSIYTASNFRPSPNVTEPPQSSPIFNLTQIQDPTSSAPEIPSSSLLFGLSQGSNRTLTSLSSFGKPSNVSSLPSINSSSLIQSERTSILAPATTMDSLHIIQPSSFLNISQMPALNSSVSIFTTKSPSVPSGPGTPFRFANFTPNWNDSNYLIPSNARLGPTNRELLTHDGQIDHNADHISQSLQQTQSYLGLELGHGERA